MYKQVIVGFIALLVFECTPIETKIVDKSTVEVNSNRGLTYVDNQLFSGILTEHSPSGVLISQVSYVAGKQEGKADTWYSNGQLKESRYFTDNKKTDVHRGYWADGTPSFQYHFEEGKYTDTLKEWYPNGQLYKLEYFENGIQIGRQKAWRMNGDLYLNYDVRNGRKYGNAGIKHCKSLWNEVDTDM